MKVAVSRFEGGIGDQVATTVAVRAVREKHKDDELTWVVGARYLPLMYDQYHLGADSIIGPERGIYSSSDWPEYDATYDLISEQQYQMAVNYDIQKSRIENWCELVGHTPSDMIPRWVCSQREKVELVEWLNYAELEPFSYVVVQWASAYPLKDYPHTELLVQELQHRGCKVVVVHHKPIPTMHCYEAIGISLRKLCVLTEQAALAIGPDSALTHISAAVQTPYLGLFGPTNPKVYLKHYPMAHYLWPRERMQSSCGFPCWCVSQQKRTCPIGSAGACLEILDAAEVADQADVLIDKYAEHNARKKASLGLDFGGTNVVTALEVLHAKPLAEQLRQPQCVDRAASL